jgi:hypothetical protein
VTTATIASIIISVDWSVEEWGLDCMRCPRWGHTINASRPSLAAIVQIAEDHLAEAHSDEPAADHHARLAACDHPRGFGTICDVCGADVAAPMPARLAAGTEEG